MIKGNIPLLLNGKSGSQTGSMVSLDGSTSAYLMSPDNPEVLNENFYVTYNSKKYTNIEKISSTQFTTYSAPKTNIALICMLDWSKGRERLTHVNSGEIFDLVIVPYATDITTAYKICDQIGGCLPTTQTDLDFDVHTHASLLYRGKSSNSTV